MNKLAAHNINSFRTAQELSSSEPAKLKRTIAELEARISMQDILIAQQNEDILSQSQELQQKKDELHAIKKMGGKPDQEHYDIPEGFENFLEKERLEKANKKMEALIDEFEDGFWTLLSERRQGLDECLKALEQLPSTPETKSLYAHVKKEWQAIEAAKKRGIISPVNALRQLAFNQLCAPISSAKGQNATQPVAAIEGTTSDKTLVNDGVCPGLAPLVADLKMERAKGFEPSTITLAR